MVKVCPSCLKTFETNSKTPFVQQTNHPPHRIYLCSDKCLREYKEKAAKRKMLFGK